LRHVSYFPDYFSIYVWYFGYGSMYHYNAYIMKVKENSLSLIKIVIKKYGCIIVVMIRNISECDIPCSTQGSSSGTWPSGKTDFFCSSNAFR
jgi:hypothetical protein